MPFMMNRVEVDWYTTWQDLPMITLVGPRCATVVLRPRTSMALTREEARALRDDLTKALEEITQDEENENAE